MHHREFCYSIDLDGNRASDGVDLRYRFGDDNGYLQAVIADILDVRGSSILEMMVALCIRCEESIMDDPDIGNRTTKWFFDMIDSLGLSDMTDENFDEDRVNYILDVFLDREYEPNGKGGLFTLKHPRHDMRNAEIWYQCMWYLDEVLGV